MLTLGVTIFFGFPYLVSHTYHSWSIQQVVANLNLKGVYLSCMLLYSVSWYYVLCTKAHACLNTRNGNFVSELASNRFHFGEKTLMTFFLIYNQGKCLKRFLKLECDFFMLILSAKIFLWFNLFRENCVCYKEIIQITTVLKTTVWGHWHITRHLETVRATPFFSFQPKVSLLICCFTWQTYENIDHLPSKR